MRRRSELDSVYSYFVQATAFQSGRSKPMGVYGSELHCIRGIAWRKFSALAFFVLKR
jgi:hypothetical protein